MKIRRSKIDAPKKGKARKQSAPKAKKEKAGFKSAKMGKSLSFKLEVAVFILLTVFFSVLILTLNYSISRDSIKSYTELSSNILERSSDALTYWLQSYFKDLRVYTKNEVFLSGDVQKINDFILENPQLMGIDFDYVGICGLDGTFYASNGSVSDVSGTKYFSEVVNKGNPECISDPELSPITNTMLFYVAVPAVNENGILFGMFVGAVPVGIIQNEISKTISGIQGYSFAIDSDGVTIAHPKKELVMKNLYLMSEDESGLVGYKAIVKDMLMGHASTGTMYNKDESEKEYIFYCPINGTYWSIALAISEGAVRASARKNGLNIAGSSVIIMILLMVFIGIYMRILLRPLLKLRSSIADIASGDADLTKKIDITTKDEIGSVVLGFNQFIENLHKIISEIKQSKVTLEKIDTDMQRTTDETGSSIAQISSNIDMVSAQVEAQGESVNTTVSAITQIAKNIENLDRLIENQANGMNEASVAIEEMLGNISSVSKSTEHMADSFSLLERYTRTGIEKQNVVNKQISLIEEQSLILMNANKTISKIASETNLLAMNAAIEAAHAGVAGQGFSVVADEIRALSETSSIQSKSIGAEIQKIQESIATVVESSGEAKKAFSDVSDNIQQTDTLVRQIKAAMEESTQGSKQISDALRMMKGSTAEVQNSSSEMAVGNKSILGEVQNLQEATQTIRESIANMSDDAKKIDNNGSTLFNISSTMQQAIRQIGNQIDLFKV